MKPVDKPGQNPPPPPPLPDNRSWYSGWLGKKDWNFFDFFKLTLAHLIRARLVVTLFAVRVLAHAQLVGKWKIYPAPISFPEATCLRVFCFYNLILLCFRSPNFDFPSFSSVYWMPLWNVSRQTLSRVRTGPGKPGKSCCGIFQDCKVLEKDHWSWKVLEICLTQLKKYEVYGGAVRRINIEILGV